jgi:hypothetical protein
LRNRFVHIEPKKFDCEKNPKILQNIAKLFAKMLSFAKVTITKNNRNRH